MTVENRARSGLPSAERRCVVCDHASNEPRCPHCGAAASAGRYTVTKQIAQTPRGRMYLAQDAAGNRVALKELVFSAIPNLQQLESFRREARLLAELDHPGIPKFVDSFEEGTGVGTRLYLAQEFVDGESLADSLAKRRIEETEATAIAARVLEILVWLQSRSPAVFHRDVKPANVIRRPDGSIALVDFGSARDTLIGTLGATIDVGTYGYAPPEQLGGDVGPTSDLYALGATLVHLLTRVPPKEALSGPGLANLTLSERMRSWLERMLAPLPQNRFANAAAALRALRGAPSEERAGKPKAGEVRARLHVAAAISVAALLAGVALAAVGAVKAQKSTAPPKPFSSSEWADTALSHERVLDRMVFRKAIVGEGPSDAELREIVEAERATLLAMEEGKRVVEAQKAYRQRHGQWLLFDAPTEETWKALAIHPPAAVWQFSASLSDEGKLHLAVSGNYDRDGFLDRMHFNESQRFMATQVAFDTVNFDYMTLTITAQPDSGTVVQRLAETESRAQQARSFMLRLADAQRIHKDVHGAYLLYDELTPALASRLELYLPSPLHHRHSAALIDGKLVLRASGNIDGDAALDTWVKNEGSGPEHESWDWERVD